MSDKERLKDIKNARYFFHDVQDSDLLKDWNWLMERAERVQELEEENISLKAIKAGNEELIKMLEQQNKRYREALKNIYQLAEYDEYDNTLEQIVSEVEKALEGEE